MDFLDFDHKKEREMSRGSDNAGCIPGLLKALFGSREDAAPAITYSKRKLLSPAERSFYGVLCRAVGEKHVVFAKVRLSDLLEPPRGKGRQAAWNRIQSKHVDFVVCDADTLQARLVIELDDASHDRGDRTKRDDFLDTALQSAGMPILHFPCRKAYPLNEVADAVNRQLATQAARDESSAQFGQ